MNLTEMESKVREATNNEPWGASTTLMSQIASGTYNYREREEILSFIFRRFTEKAANEWRQIYKSLQLLEYLIKNGSERIIDDIRANLSLIQMLKSFHYIDSKGRDQGINVRNRAKAIVNLLNDDSLIRSERKKARANAKKFGGVASHAYGGAPSRVTGPNFGDDGDYTNRVFGDGGVYGERYDDTASRYGNGNSADNFEEYDPESTSHGASRPTAGPSKVHATGSSSKDNKPAPAAPPQPDLLQDLVSFDDPAKAATSGQSNVADADDDDFDDFQAAPAASQAQKPDLTNNLSSLYQTSNIPAAAASQTLPQNRMFQPAPQATPSGSRAGSSSFASTPGPAKSSNNDAFSNLFSSAKSKTKPTSPEVNSPLSFGNNNQKDNSDFGDFSSNTPANTNPSNGNSSNKKDEIDLLSF